MRKALLLFLLCPSLFSITTGSSINRAPATVYINQQMGVSLAVWNYTYCSGCSLTVLDIIPRGWQTIGTAGSLVPVSWDKPGIGPGQPTTISPGSSVIFYYSGVFFVPSISPAYSGAEVPASSSSSLLVVGTQTFTVDALVRTNNGETNTSDTKTVKVLPIDLPNAQH